MVQSFPDNILCYLHTLPLYLMFIFLRALPLNTDWQPLASAHEYFSEVSLKPDAM